VIIDAFGSDAAIDAFTEHLSGAGPPAAHVREVEWRPIPFETTNDFTIIASEVAEERNISIPPDLATCGDCLNDIFDPTNRRFLYPSPTARTAARATRSSATSRTTARRRPCPPSMCADCRRSTKTRRPAAPCAAERLSCVRRSLSQSIRADAIATDLPIHFAARAIQPMIVAVRPGGFHSRAMQRHRCPSCVCETAAARRSRSR
jgi:hypothetical protein